VFLRVASSVVFKGMLVGNVLALAFCLIQGTTHLIPLDPVNYYVSWVPVHVDLLWIVVADAVAYGGIMLLLLIPTLFISRVDPAKTVRAE
jgi:lipoprotein-releasing system permease protein